MMNESQLQDLADAIELGYEADYAKDKIQDGWYLDGENLVPG